MVTYHPGENLPNTLRSVLSQVDRLIIVDNHSDPKSLEMLLEVVDETGSTLVVNPENKGVATALNIGIGKALEAGYEWVLTLDQDTILHEGYIAALSRAGSAFGPHRETALIGGNFFDVIGDRIKMGYALAPSCEEFIEVPTVITSGCLMSMTAFRKLGPFREEFFIDHVDHDYCLRARDHGYRVVLCTAVLMQHSIGSVSYHRFLGKLLETSNHSALRRYYWHRNGFALAREYLTREPAWALKILFFYFPTGLINLLLFEKEKTLKIKHVVQGIMDGLFGHFTRRVSDSV